MSFSQVVAHASTRRGSSPDSPVLAEEELEMTRHDPAMRDFFNPEDSDSEEDNDDEEEEQQLLHTSPFLTQEAASSLLGLFGAPAPPVPLQPPLPTPVRPQQHFHAASTSQIDRASLIQASGLSTEEQAFINATSNGKNKKRYEDTKLSLERRFFQTLKDFGGPHLQPYLQMEKIDHGDPDFQFSAAKRPQKP
jgi:hypothetical protein